MLYHINDRYFQTSDVFVKFIFYHKYTHLHLYYTTTTAPQGSNKAVGEKWRGRDVINNLKMCTLECIVYVTVYKVYRRCFLNCELSPFCHH